jgi:uncharacterized protein (DUF433 family)
MKTTPTAHAHILLWPDGTPTLSGTRLKVKHVAALHRYNGKTAEELQHSYPSHTLGEIYSALAFYHDHKDEMDREMDEDEREFDAARAAAAKDSLILAKLRARGLVQ